MCVHERAREMWRGAGRCSTTGWTDFTFFAVVFSCSHLPSTPDPVPKIPFHPFVAVSWISVWVTFKASEWISTSINASSQQGLTRLDVGCTNFTDVRDAVPVCEGWLWINKKVGGLFSPPPRSCVKLSLGEGNKPSLVSYVSSSSGVWANG